MECLKDQISILRSLLLVPTGCVPPAVFLYGHPSTGKTTALSAVLSEFSGPRAVVSCVECYTPLLLYQLVLRQLSDTERKCDGISSFVTALQAIGTERPDENIAIVLEGAERLRDLDEGVLSSLLRLQELTGRPVCLLLTSNLVWDKFQTPGGLPQPLLVHFPQYSREALQSILALDRPSDVDEQFYSGYLNLILSVFVVPCRNVRELRHLARASLAHYRAPVLSGEVAPTDLRRLWRHVEPHLRAALRSVYLREADSAQWLRTQTQLPAAAVQPSSHDQPGILDAADHQRLNTELPFYSKFLLIAAYLASYNPAKSDRRFFVKRTGKGAGRLKARPPAGARVSALLTGPRAFPLDRLLAIFYVIVEDRVAPTASIYSQVSSLVTLRMLTRLGGSDNLDSAKYKCLVSFDTVKSIAKTVNFEVEWYLYDFV
ncbi:origin recognition complex subunit 5-like [Amphibalanus amphitrite]|uniref:origin recognition complex subunit 5-like n=1 Tax=Amphibalanus amphitrite TaxID=1232801 RepID=UPI001C903B0D|nr:origin recognition complex subunit 5-like [Amphibalanus amphitrite]XP_043194962.1 origin recognition complex subunit 5-like [Amphibalanus amphitrite]XP_043194963.1 origin recognition complex subunit 5-like [Amphibalanus amphitrite]XP_043194964.1 origin recognition complex subunit 5-like [Amphibalanus amphitrite]XP_043194965.1 origin recognition complex subunit 5-like [Amphibalanus amphitrite]XP_043194966.1 origin recognition complex subunit 5-like [Amphibalanus amphitrite]XP_043194967.1 or